MRVSVFASGVVAALVGFGSTFALVVAAAQAVGANAAETGSWVAMLCLAIAATTAFLSIRHRMPIITAWSTPGVALMAGAPAIYTLSEAVGAFIVAGVLVVVTAAFRPLGALIGRIPMPVASAMLAGVLFGFAAKVFAVLPGTPQLVLPLVIVFFIVRLFSPAAAVLTVLVGGVALTFALGLTSEMPADISLSRPIWIAPQFDVSTLIGLGLPLYLVTMASQNLAGFAVLRSAGYEPPVASILGATGIGSVLTAPFGAHASNLAAMTAAICCGPDTHPDPSRRWLTGPVYAFTYLVLAAFAAAFVGLFAAMPAALIVTVGGLALIAPLQGALTSAMEDKQDRLSPLVTFLVTASGMTVFGVGSALWGLVAGLAIGGLAHARGTAGLSRTPPPR